MWVQRSHQSKAREIKSGGSRMDKKNISLDHVMTVFAFEMRDLKQLFPPIFPMIIIFYQLYRILLSTKIFVTREMMHVL
jgi:hypothetical protein